MTTEDFGEPFGNISLGLSDEHGNEVDLECTISRPREMNKITWEQVSQLHLVSNITFSVDIGCTVDREKYERLWRLIAYYSNVPAHLKRIMLRKEPNPTYVYRQDPEKDAQYYTGLKVNINAQPEWLMQTSADLQLNRRQSSAKMVKLILSTDISETVEAELVQRQRRMWVMIESTNRTQKVFSALLGSQTQMECNVHSSGQPVIHWMLPDGSKVEAPYRSSDNRISVSNEGQLVIKAVSHQDTGIYYCIAKVHGDFAVLPFHLTVQESSTVPLEEDASSTPIEGFVGNPISLPCSASGSPDAEINWLLPNNKIIGFWANSSRALVYSNGTLHIPHTQLLDNGHYKCIAINQHGVDTLVRKVTLTRRKGILRPLRKFPTGPQSASGVNTQIKVPTEDTEEASGDIEVTQINRVDMLRRRIPGGVATGRRGIHPSRNMWRRPPMLRKPIGSRVEDRNDKIDNRRKINMSKSKIDPEKWADILAKIRDRTVQNTATPQPVQRTTAGKKMEQTTQSQETTEGSSVGMNVQQKEHRYYPTTLQNQEQHIQKQRTDDVITGQDTHVISDKYIEPYTHGFTSESQHVTSIPATVGPHTTQTTFNVQHITPAMNLDLHTTSNSVFFLPQTTSAPRHAVTLWQANTNTASSSSAFFLQENHSTNTDVDGVKTADWAKGPETDDMDRSNVISSSNNERKFFLSESQTIPTVSLNESYISQEENGKYLNETVTSQSHMQFDLQPQAMLTTASPRTTPALTTTRRKESEGNSVPRLRQPNSRRRNGGRGKRPNRRKQKLNEPTQFIVTTPANDILATVRTTDSLQLKIELLEVTTAHFNTTVPFSSGQPASSGRLSHEEGTDSEQNAEGATRLPTPLASSPETNNSPVPSAKPLFKEISAVPSFPTAHPEVGHGKTSSQTAMGISERASPAGSLLPPVKPSEETQRENITEKLGPTPHADDSSRGFPTGKQVETDVGLNQSGHQYTPSVQGERMVFKETGIDFPLQAPSSTSAATLLEHGTQATTLKSSNTSPSSLFDEDLDTGHLSITKPQVQETLHHSSSKNKTTDIESELYKHLDQSGNRENTTDKFISAVITAQPSITSSRTDAVIPSRMAPHVVPFDSFPTSAKVFSSLKVTTDVAPRINSVPHNPTQNQQIQPTSTSDFPSVTWQPESTGKMVVLSRNPTSSPIEQTDEQTIKQAVTPAPTIAAIQTHPFTEQLLTSTQDYSKMHRLPGQGSVPKGKPRINKDTVQTFTVKAETDAQLPCEADGEPMPFLSWTKVSSGTCDSIS